MMDNPTPGERSGDVIDRYTLIEEVGEGGMGSVWRARQSEPVKRDVAFKIIKLGMDTKEVVVRFEAERQALALMDHPHIAKVLDGGATEGGRPYFVMELVEGEPITDYCDRARLGVRERLELFTKVCEGIQHAHQKGVIHRDIKPGNVLVALQDGEPVPKVIDFGIAKATGASLTEKTMQTELGQMLGTPEYMAPEQLGMSGADIDTRADVYSLGVLLYELLTGSKPFDIQKIIAAGYDELLRTIREVDPEKPSTRITKLDDTRAIAELRQLDVRGFSKQLSGDLDWVVMKALEKERVRRYETADGLAADVQRYLDLEPVAAAPPSATYRLRKFVKRRKKTVAAVAVIVLLMIVGSVGTGVGLWKALQANRALDVALGEKDEALAEEERQRELAENNEQLARDAEGRAREEAARARVAEAESQARAAELEQVSEYQATQLSRVDPALMGIRLREAMLQATPEESREGLSTRLQGINFTNLALESLHENLLVGALESIDGQFANQPAVRAHLLQALATTQVTLGLVEAAVDPQERALAIRRELLGDDHPSTLESTGEMGILLRNQGRLSEALPLWKQTLDGRRQVFGDQHPETLAAVSNMGLLLNDLGRVADSEPYYIEATEGARQLLGDDDPATLIMKNNLGFLLMRLGRLDEAEVVWEEVLERRRRVLGDDHRDTLASLNNLGSLLRTKGDLKRTEKYWSEALGGFRRVLGDEHPETLVAISNMGLVLSDRGRRGEAEVLYREVLEGRRWVLGSDHPETITSLGNLAYLLREMRKPAESEPFFREALYRSQQVLGVDHVNTRTLSTYFGRALRDLVVQTRSGGDEVALADALLRQGELELYLGRAGEAEQILSEAADQLFAALPETDMRIWRAIGALGTAVAEQGRVIEAESILLESAERALELPRSAAPEVLEIGPPTAVDPLQRIIQFYEVLHEADPTSGHDASAEEWRDLRSS